MDFYTFDDEYVRRLREGDREVSEHFEKYFGQLLMAKLRRRLRTKQDIEDVRQETLLRVLSKLSELHDSSKLGAFVHSVCDIVLKEWFRKHPDKFDPLEIDIRSSVDLDRELIDEESRREVREVLTELPPQDVELLRAVFFEDADKDEICARFGVGREYLRVRLHRAKKRFRDLFSRRKKKKKPPDPEKPPKK